MSKRISFAVMSTALALLAASGPASAENACIPPKVSEALADCSGIDLKVSSARRTAVTIPAVAPPNKGTSRATAPPPNPKLSAVEIRRGLTALRSEQLLITQIQGLETLLGSTPASAPDRPGIMKRLADAYVELEATSFRKRIQNAANVKAGKVEIAARQAAIKVYGQLKTQYPRWCQNAGPTPAQASGCVDETLYNLAYEHEQAGELDQARKVYLELIQTAPSSRYVPTAYLAFGELFFQEAQGDPAKWALAEQSYKEVIRYPAPDNKASGYAHYKLAYVYWNKGDLALAVAELKRTIDVGVQFPTLPNAEQLAVSARRDLVPLYALAGDAKKAYAFFHPLSGDRSSENAGTFRLLTDLGQGYLDVGHYAEAIDLYQDLLRRDRGPKSCGYQAHITEATLALKTGDKAAAKAELDRQLAFEQRFRSEGHPDDVKLACANATASLAVETAMIWHLEAVGSGNVRGTMSQETMSLAADLYDQIIKRWSAPEFARFEFPRVVKEDWPTLLKVKAARADLLYAEKDWARCGAAFDAVVDEDPRGPLAAESAYASALCHQRAHLASHPGGSDRAGLGAQSSIAPRDLRPDEKTMLTSFNRFLCVTRPNASDKAAYDNYVEVEFARARTYFDAHRWTEAAAAFRPLALLRGDHELGIVAAQLYLESLNVMGAHGTPSCIDDMQRDMPRILEQHCAGGKATTNVAECATLVKIQRDLDWHVIDERARALGEDTGPEHAKQWEEIANGYLRIWNTYGKDACAAKQPACERMDDVLFNAARAFQAARLLAKAIAVRKVLLDGRYNLDRTQRARQTIHELGKNYQAIAVYDEAATWYERVAHDDPAFDKAPEALQDAIVLRLGLGQEEQALHDAEVFQTAYRGKHAAQAAQIGFAISAHFAEHGDFAQARKHLSTAMSEIDRSGTIDVQIQAHAMLGRVLSKTGGEAGAAAEYAKVRSLYKDPVAVESRLRAAGEDSAQATRRLVKVLTAVGESMYFFAEQKRKAADALKFPVYTGSGRREDVLAYIQGKAADWMKKKRPAIEEAEREYTKVLEIQPAPPPRWVIASGARVGQLWGRFVAEVRSAPVPREWKKSGPSPYGDLTWEEIRTAYIGAVDDASEADRRRAKAAYQKCLDYSSRYQHFDENSRACELWLSKNYGAEYHAIDELRSTPSRIGFSIDGQPATIAP